MTQAHEEPDTLEILGVEIRVLPREDALATLLNRLAARSPTKVAFANSNLLMSLRSRPDGAGLLDDFLILNDGLALDLAAKYRHGRTFPDNLVGTDFVPQLVARLPAGTRLFLLGAKPSVAEKAAERLATFGPVTICGVRHGYDAANVDVAADIAAASPDVLLVAMGNPLQEAWIDAFAPQTGAVLALGVGALFDVLASEVPRAPLWVRNLRCEWLFRLSQEPRRLARRYTVDMSAFFLAVVSDGRARQATSRRPV